MMEFKDTSQRLRFRDTRNIRLKNIEEMENRLQEINNRRCAIEEELIDLNFEYVMLQRDLMMKRFLDDLEDYDHRGFDLNKLIYDTTDYSL